MKFWPLRFREFGKGRLLFSDEAGGYFAADPEFLQRYVSDDRSVLDITFLTKNGHTFSTVGDVEFMGFASRWAKRVNFSPNINYVILVPTLRCDLHCDYCQVSRVSQNARGFDWDEATIQKAIDWLMGLESPSIKIEFQGGEPLLRLDILERVRTACRNKFISSEFVVCTNLQDVTEAAWSFLASDDTFISTSLDGTFEIHQAQRTKKTSATAQFRANLDYALSEFGPKKVSALPTIDPMAAPEPMDMIRSFAERGLTSIFLRSVNYQGFARKKYDFEASGKIWNDYYQNFILTLIEYNNTAPEPMEEYYFSHILKRIVQGGHNGYVDLRNPNWLAQDYLVIDYNGTFYPTDEARMITRVGQIDLSIGSLDAGLDVEKVTQLNTKASNYNDPDCLHCTYQTFCGVDRIDELSRHGRIDLPRHLTAHCVKHLSLFDFAFELLYSEDAKVQSSLASWLKVPRFSPKLAPRLA